MTGEESEKLLEKAARELGEHFDAVQILATWNEKGLTYCSKRGAGNWYARQDMAHEFIQQDIAQEHANRIASKLEPPPDDSESWKKA